MEIFFKKLMEIYKKKIYFFQETKFLLPKPALSARDIKPPQWVNMVQGSWQEVKHNPSLGSREVHKQFGPDQFSRYWIQTNKQTPKHPDKQSISIDK